MQSVTVMLACAAVAFAVRGVDLVIALIANPGTAVFEPRYCLMSPEIPGILASSEQTSGRAVASSPTDTGGLRQRRFGLPPVAVSQLLPTSRSGAAPVPGRSRTGEKCAVIRTVGAWRARLAHERSGADQVFDSSLVRSGFNRKGATWA